MQSLTPEHQPEFYQDEDTLKSCKSLSLAPVFSGEAFNQAVQYQIVVEMWDKRRYGRIGRAYSQAFTESEKRILSKYYTKFYKWYFVSGTPKRVMLRLRTLQLLQKAVHFFATI